MNSLKVTPLSIEKIRKTANSIRNSLDEISGVEKKYKFPIVEFIENILPKLFDEFIFEILSEEEMGDYHGLTYTNEGNIKIREDVYLNAVEGKGRDRFTMAHELGHFLLHNPKNVILARTKSKTKIYEDAEWQADTFAAELLMPIDMITDEDDIDSISRKFGVSAKAAEVRLNKVRH
ncbi:ImmA/IrrE family metallo-endopeptidase [Clostridioides difficile]|uniref:ImmA/IrrE family metallo-endopeptidase n=1 Tax=Clostridioides difficile TaxID=1496 RepID=UPI000CDEF1C2|nr:ImmA/IrrE family metallo-endopeptidase [Clostridioides difficile]MCO4409188.1 ImmA/IrrE family metallo-endopeptidase [Clostridioides difficile]HBF5908433.1 ImmA/IrrE family metallo-endopeptidase [Clostridioides difficile]HBF6217473.1 ImmA/IrrE family metallo-endopeptidase [Clostridioides difficile]HBF6292082.1 ImmA/IrrE family metallo-endopeptidase [Clostridioides difficile]HBF6482858.1 ImmA/IrrE family metallo-endopeptidase [Clostridioides difficile]